MQASHKHVTKTGSFVPNVTNISNFGEAEQLLVRFEARPAAPLRLFCFPWSGASASSFRELAACLPDGIETIGLQLPGRGSRRDEPAHARLAPLAGQIVRSLDAELGERPGRFALFGHSFGALLAYEVARRLEAAGRHPDLVVLSGSGRLVVRALPDPLAGSRTTTRRLTLR